MSDGCDFCRVEPAYFFDWRCAGCRTRWLATLPSREWRIHAVNQWRKDGETEMVDSVIAELHKLAEETR